MLSQSGRLIRRGSGACEKENGELPLLSLSQEIRSKDLVLVGGVVHLPDNGDGSGDERSLGGVIAGVDCPASHSSAPELPRSRQLVPYAGQVLTAPGSKSWSCFTQSSHRGHALSLLVSPRNFSSRPCIWLRRSLKLSSRMRRGSGSVFTSNISVIKVRGTT